MILSALNDLYDRLADEDAYQLAPLGYSLQKITFKVVIAHDGALVGIEDTRAVSGSRRIPVQLIVPGNNKPSGSGLNPCFLWDNSQYMLGVKQDDPKPDRTAVAFEAFRDRHLRAEAEIDAPEFSAVCRFLEAWNPEVGRDHPVLSDAGLTGFGVFQLVGQPRYVHGLAAIRSWWMAQQVPADDAELGHCLVTGDVAPLARTHAKIRGVMGGQSAGGTIVGFNAPAYESYGKTQSYNAPVSEAVAFRYVSALNAILDGPKRDLHRFRLADTTVAFWTDRPSAVQDFFAQFATTGAPTPKPEAQDPVQLRRVNAFLDALRQGRERYADLGGDPEQTRFCLLGLSPNVARISVRFFHRGTIVELIERLREHFADMQLARRPTTDKWPGDPEFPSLRDLLDQTGRTSDDIPPLLAGPLAAAVIEGRGYPSAMFAATLRRIRAERHVTYLRGCILKAYLNRNLNQGITMALDQTRTDPAYRMGRLFAALEKTQQDALGRNLNKTIRDTFYSSASATPRAVFPRLLRTYQHHLSKLQGGLRVNRERLVQEIVAPLETFPAHLDLAGQGAFAIGYYHQNDAFYRKPVDASEPDPQEIAS